MEIIKEYFAPARTLYEEQSVVRAQLQTSILTSHWLLRSKYLPLIGKERDSKATFVTSKDRCVKKYFIKSGTTAMTLGHIPKNVTNKKL